MALSEALSGENMLKLFLVDGEQNRTVVPLLRSEITIGRGEGNTIRLTDQNISRVHARLVRTASGYTLEDLSRYGIEGPKGRIQGSSPVVSGEAYRIGDYQLEFKEERASLPLPAARPRPPLPTGAPAPATSSFASTESAPGASSMTPPGTGTAVFLADDIDNALSALDTKPSAGSVAVSTPLDSGSSTAGSLAVEPEPSVERPSSVVLAAQPPSAPSATAPSTVAMAAPSSASDEVATEPARSTMTLRPTSVQAMKLVGQTAPFGGAELQLTLPRMVIGSGPSCDVVLEHSGIAPEHLALRYDGTSWWVDALSGQVRVDGDLTPTTKLWKGAVITLGGLDFRFADPLERQSVRLAPVAATASAPAPAAAAASWLPAPARDLDSEFDQAILNRGKRNQKIGIGVGVALALGIVGLLAAGGKDEPGSSAGSGSAAAEVAAVAPAPAVAAGSGSGAAALAAGSGSGTAVEVAAVVPDAAAKAAADAKAAEEAKAAADAKAAAEAKAAADSVALARTAQAAQGGAEAKAAAEAGRAAKAAADRQAAADRKAAADAAKEARAAKAAEAAAARAARQPPKQAAPARTAAPAPTPARAATPVKATPPTPFQEVAPAAPAAPTAASLISDAKRAAVQNNRKDAVKFLEQARRIDPKNAEVNQLLFSNYRALGNTLRASEAVKRYLALKPNDSHRADYEKWLEQNATP